MAETLSERIEREMDQPLDGVIMMLSGCDLYERSLVEQDGVIYALTRSDQTKELVILARGGLPDGFHQTSVMMGMGAVSFTIFFCPCDHTNALALRQHLPWTASSPIGLHMSAGLGDRLGIATPGHIRAIRHGLAMKPFLAQQSIREMERTHRTPEGVIDDATWGVFEEGWRAGYGSDADHLKSCHDIDVCIAAGFVLYTFDPLDLVDNDAQEDSLATLRLKYVALPWHQLETTAQETRDRYQGQQWALEDSVVINMTEEHLLRAACKYGAAIAHISDLYRHLVANIGEQPYEVEVSIDESETPTRAEEHWYIASELKRLGVTWVSLAPRYIGRFEKGVDYIGDLDVFEQDLIRQAAVAKALGPYKLSLHSGSDKFSIYPIAARVCGELVHLKTAGTSYLEALRAIGHSDPALLREVFAFAIAHYEKDKQSYHVSAELAKVPAPESVADEALPDLLDQFDARQVFHVTFGTVLTTQNEDGSYLFRDRIYTVLKANEETHYDALEAHLTRHLLPFCQDRSQA